MAKEIRVNCILKGSSRRPNSENGNPRFELHTDAGNLRTKTDADVNFIVQNLTGDVESGLNIPVTLVGTDRQHIYDIIVREDENGND